MQNALKSGVNAKQGVSPHAAVKDVVKAYADDLYDKAQRLYIPAGGMTQQQAEELKNALQE